MVPPKPQIPHFQSPGGSPQPPQVLIWRGGQDLGSLGPQGCGRDPAPSVSHTHVPPSAPASHSGSAWLPQQNKFCWAIKRRWKRGRPGEQSESMPELLQVVTGLRVRANNAICPWDRGTRNTTTAAQTPNTGSRGRQWVPELSWATPCPWGLSHTWLCLVAQVGLALWLLPLSPVLGRVATVSPQGQALHRCHSCLAERPLTLY